MNSAVTYIYGLREPDTQLIRYIGKSTRPDGRLRDHLRDRSACYRTHWLNALRGRGLTPELVILEEIRGEWPWQEAERFWISYARENAWPLVNGTSGGDGVPDLSPESRARIVAAWRGRTHTDETRARLRQQRLGVPLPESTRASMSKAHRGRVITWGDTIAKAIRKLTPEDATIIRKRLANGERTGALAAEYGVHRTTLSKIKMGTYFDRYRPEGGK